MSKRLKCTSIRITISIIIITILSIWFILFIQFQDFNFGTSSHLTLGITHPIDTNLSISTYTETRVHVDYNINHINQHIHNENASEDTSITNQKIALIAYGGDSAAGYATNYFTYTINFILHAQSLNMEISIEYNSQYNSNYYDSNIGDNSFNYWFEPIQSKLSKTVVFPYNNLSFIHHVTNDSIHAWYYSIFTQSIFNQSLYNETWYYNNRLTASQIVAKYIHPKPEIIAEANEIWSKLTATNSSKKVIVLGAQMRGTDKGGLGRHKVEPDTYMPYIINFIRYYDNLGYIPKVFIATDDKNYFRYIETYWNHESYLETYQYSDIILQQHNVIRSKFRKSVFGSLKRDISKYEAGKQCLLDILLLSKCDYFIHSASAVAEAVHWNNIKLHKKSIHLEYKYNRQIPIWYDRNKYQKWPQYESIIYAKSENCGITRFSQTLVNIFCDEMFSIHALSASHCREACCADYNECDTFLWCSNFTLGGKHCKRASCWIGHRQIDNCYKLNGWLGATTPTMT